MLSNFVECFEYSCNECADLFQVNYEIVWDDNGDECQDIDWPSYELNVMSEGEAQANERRSLGI